MHEALRLGSIARQGGKDILGDLLRRAGVFKLPQRRAVNEIQMPPHHSTESGLLAVAREALQPFKILTSLVHLYP